MKRSLLFEFTRIKRILTIIYGKFYVHPFQKKVKKLLKIIKILKERR